MHIASLESDVRTATVDRCALESAAFDLRHPKRRHLRQRSCDSNRSCVRPRWTEKALRAQCTRVFETAVSDAVSQTQGLSTGRAVLSSEREKNKYNASGLRKRLEKETWRASVSDKKIIYSL